MNGFADGVHFFPKVRKPRPSSRRRKSGNNTSENSRPRSGNLFLHSRPKSSRSYFERLRKIRQSVSPVSRHFIRRLPRPSRQYQSNRQHRLPHLIQGKLLLPLHLAAAPTHLLYRLTSRQRRRRCPDLARLRPFIHSALFQLPYRLATRNSRATCSTYAIIWKFATVCPAAQFMRSAGPLTANGWQPVQDYRRSLHGTLSPATMYKRIACTGIRSSRWPGRLIAGSWHRAAQTSFYTSGNQGMINCFSPIKRMADPDSTTASARPVQCHGRPMDRAWLLLVRIKLSRSGGQPTAHWS